MSFDYSTAFVIDSISLTYDLWPSEQTHGGRRQQKRARLQQKKARMKRRRSDMEQQRTARQMARILAAIRSHAA